MNHLVFLIISIVLMSSMTGLAIKYVPSDAYQKQQTFQGLMQGYGSMHEATVRYLQDNRDAQGLLPYPGAGVDLKDVVFPRYGFLPAKVSSDVTWQVTTGQVYGQQAVGLCAKPVGAELSERTQRAMELVQAQMPQSSTFLGTACNATANVAGGNHMTYWVILSHLD